MFVGNVPIKTKVAQKIQWINKKKKMLCYIFPPFAFMLSVDSTQWVIDSLSGMLVWVFTWKGNLLDGAKIDFFMDLITKKNSNCKTIITKLTFEVWMPENGKNSNMKFTVGWAYNQFKSV